MKLSIIILNYKSKGLLKQCLKGVILSQPKIDYEIIVVDNNSGDKSLEITRGLLTKDYFSKHEKLIGKEIIIPPFKTIQSPVNGGFSAGNNIGIKASEAQYFMILNPDIAIVPGVIEKMVEYMDANREVGIVGPKLLNPDKTVQYSCRRFPNYLVPLFRRTAFGKLSFAKKLVEKYLMIDFDHNKTIEVDWLFGACLVVRRSATDKIGLLDERYFMYFEDMDYCRRFWENGYKIIYLSDVEIIHYHAQYSSEKEGILGILSRGGQIHLISGLKYFLKYRGKKFEKRV